MGSGFRTLRMEDPLERAVGAFAVKMMKRMKENSHKTGWDNTAYLQLFKERLEHNVREACDGRPEACLDIANYAMMLYKCLKRRLKRSGLDGVINRISPKIQHKHRS